MPILALFLLASTAVGAGVLVSKILKITLNTLMRVKNKVRGLFAKKNKNTIAPVDAVVVARAEEFVKHLKEEAKKNGTSITLDELDEWEGKKGSTVTIATRGDYVDIDDVEFTQADEMDDDLRSLLRSKGGLITITAS